MPQGPITRIVIRRPDGRTEILGRVGHVDPHKATRDFATHGEVLVVRHEMMPIAGRAQTLRIHEVKR